MYHVQRLHGSYRAGEDMIDTSEFVRDLHLPSSSGHPDSVVFQASYSSDDAGSDSEPDIDAVMARCTIGVVDDTVSGSKTDEVDLFPSSSSVL